LDSNPVFGVCLDRFDHQIELVGTVRLAGYASEIVGGDRLGVGKVAEPIYAFGVKVFHGKHHAGFALRPREQCQIIRAEVEHKKLSKVFGGVTQ
jgi:hypothetical protein